MPRLILNLDSTVDPDAFETRGFAPIRRDLNVVVPAERFLAATTLELDRAERTQRVKPA